MVEVFPRPRPVRLGSAFGVVLSALGLAAAAYAAESKFHEAKADTYDPAKTFLVARPG